MAKANPLPPLSRLREVFFYPPPTGELYWKVDKAMRTRVLDKAGSLNPNGYLTVMVDGKSYKVHRIVFSIRHGVELSPDIEIDHINGDKSDNSIDNLRSATRAENNRNIGLTRANNSGLKGAHWHKKAKKWCSNLTHNKKNIHLGLYDTKEEAALAYNEAAKRLHGEFARLNEIPETPRLGRPLGEQMRLFDPPKENAQKTVGGIGRFQ